METHHAETPKEERPSITLGQLALPANEPFYIRQDLGPSSCPPLGPFLQLELLALFFPSLHFWRIGSQRFVRCPTVSALVESCDVQSGARGRRREQAEELVVSRNMLGESCSSDEMLCLSQTRLAVHEEEVGSRCTIGRGPATGVEWRLFRADDIFRSDGHSFVRGTYDCRLRRA